MKIIKNSILPFKGYSAMNLFTILFVRKEYADKFENTVKYTEMINHETIHTEQQKEMLFIFFYVWYLIEWFIKLLYYFDSYKAYKNISFEREAYDNEKNFSYLNERKRYNWLNYLRQ